MKLLKSFIQNKDLPIIYCDLDGTLIDFYAAVNRILKKHGFPDWEDLYWNSFTPEKAQEIRWEIVNKQKDLWLKMPWLFDGHSLWNYIKKYNPHILSHASEHSPHSYKDKFYWVEKNLHINNKDIIHIVLRRRDKALFAKSSKGKSNLLIDDHEKNCNDFIQAGGLAIKHTSAKDTISQLKKLGF